MQKLKAKKDGHQWFPPSHFGEVSITRLSTLAFLVFVLTKKCVSPFLVGDGTPKKKCLSGAGLSGPVPRIMGGGAFGLRGVKPCKRLKRRILKIAVIAVLAVVELKCESRNLGKSRVGQLGCM